MDCPQLVHHNVNGSEMVLTQKGKGEKTNIYFFYPRGDNLIAASTNVENTQIHIINFSLLLQKDEKVEIVWMGTQIHTNSLLQLKPPHTSHNDFRNTLFLGWFLFFWNYK